MTRVAGAVVASDRSQTRLQRVIANVKRLERLDLSGTDVTDPAPLGSLANLKELGLSQTKLTAAGKTSANALAKRGVVVVR